MNDALSQLKDIHLPPPVNWWPPAPGWWLLAVLVLAALLALAWFVRRRIKRVDLYQVSLQELADIRSHYAEEPDAQRLAAELSRLLRRVAITLWPEAEVASLTGKDWLAWLDARIDGNAFTEGAGRFLEEGTYRPGGDLQDAQALLSLVEGWLKKVTREVRRA